MKIGNVLISALAACATAGFASVINCSYDLAGRLTAADHGGGRSISYAYDAAGNLVQSSQGAPGLVFDLATPGQLTLSWPAAPSGFVLESSPAIGLAAVWTAVGTTPVQSGNQLSVIVPISGGAKFYRLRKI
jgi:YD repeat-containing protein